MKKIINVPEEELDMFAKYGIKTIIAGNKRINLVKRKKISKKKKMLVDKKFDKMFDNNIYNFIQKGI
jgi:hypothetical protein